MFKRHVITLQSLTPVAHGDTHTGIDNATNTRLFMRQAALVGGTMLSVPHISENALRTVLFRLPLADHLVKTLDIDVNSLPRAVVNLLYSGGNMGGGRAPSDEVTAGHAIRRLYPSLDLLGGAVDHFILPRSRLRVGAWLVAREYLDPIRAVAPDLADEAAATSAFDLIAEETRTRGTGSESAGNQMLYTYEVLAAGAKVVVEMTLDPWTPPETEAALGLALSLWDGYIGGQGRQGRGRMQIVVSGLPDITAYLGHIGTKRQAMRDGLVDGSLGTGKRVCGG